MGFDLRWKWIKEEIMLRNSQLTPEPFLSILG